MEFWTTLSWTGSILSMIGALINIKKRWECWIIWTIANIFLITVAYHDNRYGLILMWLVYTALNVYGFYEWKIKKEKQ